MTKRKASTSVQLARIGVLAPLVIAHRMQRLTPNAGAWSAAQLQEAQRMVNEKSMAAWNGAWAAAMWWWTWPMTFFTPATARTLTPYGVVNQAVRNAEALMSVSLAPITTQVAANARRLSRSTHR